MPDPNELPELWQRRRELGATVLRKRRLYLDIKFWSFLCDVALGESTDPDHAKMAESLRGAAAEGWLVCPIEFHTFVELIKQRLPAKRTLTAELIDELSLGVTVIMPPERVFIEALRFLQAAPAGPPFPLSPIDEVWTKTAYFVGHGSLTSKNLPPDELERLNLLFTEKLWGMSLSEILALLGDKLPTANDWQAKVAAKLNDEKGPARDRVKSLSQLYRDEFRGTLDVFAPSIGDTMVYLFGRAGGDTDAVADEKRDDAARHLISLISAALEKHNLAHQLPTTHIMATLFAAMQWDRGRKYKENDFADFGHAAAALAYCDCFATERSLAAMIRQAKLDSLYDCAVLVQPVEVTEWVNRTRPGFA